MLAANAAACCVVPAGDALQGHARRWAVQHIQGCGQAATEQQEDPAGALIWQEHKGCQQKGELTRSASHLEATSTATMLQLV